MKWFALATLLLSIALVGCSHPQPVYYVPPPPPVYRDIVRQGFRDGFQAARGDVADGRPPTIERHQFFRYPPVPPELSEDYRHGFARGYRAFLNGEASGY